MRRPRNPTAEWYRQYIEYLQEQITELRAKLEAADALYQQKLAVESTQQARHESAKEFADALRAFYQQRGLSPDSVQIRRKRGGEYTVVTKDYASIVKDHTQDGGHQDQGLTEHLYSEVGRSVKLSALQAAFRFSRN